MKHLLLSGAFALYCLTAWAQSDSGFGIKGGLNYNSNGDLISEAGDIVEKPDSNAGFHLGVFYKFGKNYYLRPELVFTRTKSNYDSGSLNISKIDLPVLAGINFIGPLHLFAGPAFQYIVDGDFSGSSLENIDRDFSVGLNVGVGVSLGRIGLDLRYERGFSKNEASFISDNIIALDENRIDTRPQQLILSLSLKI